MMDHLPWHNQDSRRPRVSFLCANCTNIEERKTVDSLSVWNHVRDSSDDQNITHETRAAKCQEWLFFGPIWVVGELTGKPLSLAAFASSGSVSETTSDLDTHCLQEWFEEVRRSITLLKFQSGSYFDTLREQYLSLLTFLSDQHGWISTAIIEAERDSGVGEDVHSRELFNIFWTTLILHEQIWTSWPDAEYLLPGYRMIPQPSRSMFAGASGVAKAFLKAGRCPTVARRMNVSALDAWTLCATSTSTINDSASIHNVCVDSNCKAFNTTMDDYNMRHNLDCTDCDLKGIDQAKLANLIQSGKIPIIRSTLNANGLRTEIIDGDLRKDYTAISHVWAGGLGNPSGNEHHECQLTRIHAAVSGSDRAGKVVYYWLDTLCIPTNNATLRKTAINEMARIYAGAENVLVIDPILGTLEANGLSSHKIALMIAASPWMARSWTLQEGALGVMLSFEFKDRVTSLDMIDTTVGPLSSSLVQALWKRDVDMLDNDWFAAPERRRRPILSKRNQLDVAWRELSSRNSTMSEDVAAILAVLIDRSAGEVLKMPQDHQIHALLRSQDEIPIYVLFAPVKNREGKWMPMVPRCSEAIDYVFTSGSLQFENELLTTSNLRDLYILRAKEDVRLSESILLFDQSEGRRFKVRFANLENPGKHKVANQTDVMFIFPRWAVQMTDKPTSQSYSGFCCHMTPSADDRGQEVARYICHFQWTIVSQGEQILLANNLNKTLPPRHEVMLFPPGYITDPSFRYKLAFDMGIQDWPRLEWSRDDFYPFMGSSIRAARVIRLISTSNGVLVAHLQLQLFMWTVLLVIGLCYHDYKNSMIRLLAKAVLGYAVLVVIYRMHVLVTNLEHLRLVRIVREGLQAMWASSFGSSKSGSDTGTESRRFQPRKILLLGIIYFLTLLLLLILVPVYGNRPSRDAIPWVPDIIPYDVFQDSAGYGRVLVGSSYMPYIYVVIEVLLRLAVIGVFLLQRFGGGTAVHHARLTRRVTDLLGTPFDPRNSWAISFEYLLAGSGCIIGSGFFAYLTKYFYPQYGDPSMPFAGWLMIMAATCLMTIGCLIAGIWHLDIALRTRTGVFLSY